MYQQYNNMKGEKTEKTSQHWDKTKQNKTKRKEKRKQIETHETAFARNNIVQGY